MKLNSKKLLTWLYPVEKTTERWRPTSEASWLLPDLSSSGRRSLIALLKREHLIFVESRQGRSLMSLTKHGLRAVEESFPALSTKNKDWQGQWSLLAFLNSPKSDPGFRYLRSVLVDQKAVALSRGNYLYPDLFPTKVIELCEDLYVGCVVIVSFKQWDFGDERAIITSLFMLSDVTTALSGISSEIDQLLRSEEATKESKDQHNKRIFMVFDRLFTNLGFDLGITHRYYPEVSTSLQSLARLQSLIE